MSFEQFFNLWNAHGKGYLKRHRLIKTLKNNKLLMQRFNASDIDSDIAITAIEEVKWFIDNDDFWASRRMKQGIPWFFQSRGKGNGGEENWAWFYEHRMNRIEEEEIKKEQHANVFAFQKTSGEELP